MGIVFMSNDSQIPANLMNSYVEKSTVIKDTHASITRQVKEFETARASLYPPIKITGNTSPFTTK